MMRFIPISFLVGSMLVACGTKKDEKKVTPTAPADGAIINQSSDNLKAPDCSEQSPNQNDSCTTTVSEVGKLVILSQYSALNARVDGQGRWQDSQGACLETLTNGQVDANLKANLDLRLQNMSLKTNEIGFGQSARCSLQFSVAYKKGYAFAIRRLSVPLNSQIKSDSFAQFQGSYTIAGRSPVEIDQKLSNQNSNRPVRIAFSVTDQKMVWSSCSGRATLNFDSTLVMNFTRQPATNSERQEAEQAKQNGSLDHGDMQLNRSEPYRIEIVWAKCQ